MDIGFDHFTSQTLTSLTLNMILPVLHSHITTQYRLLSKAQFFCTAFGNMKSKSFNSKHTGAHVFKTSCIYPPLTYHSNYRTTDMKPVSIPKSSDLSCKLNSQAALDSHAYSSYHSRIAIYKLALSTGSEDHDSEPIKFTIAQNKSRRDPHSGDRLNIYKVNNTGKDHLALISTCTQMKDELLYNITNKIVGHFESADVLSCFVAANREFFRPAAYTESRLEMLSDAKKVETLIPEWGSWDEAFVQLARMGTQLHRPLARVHR